MRSFV